MTVYTQTERGLGGEWMGLHFAYISGGSRSMYEIDSPKTAH